MGEVEHGFALHAEFSIEHGSPELATEVGLHRLIPEQRRLRHGDCPRAAGDAVGLHGEARRIARRARSGARPRLRPSVPTVMERPWRPG